MDDNDNSVSITSSKEKTPKLIILDVNGLLCRKILKTIIDTKQINHFETLELDKYIVVIRPDVRSFLSKCYSFGKVGFWSSTNQINAEPILKHILTEEQFEGALFKWYRPKTRPDPETSKFATMKVLDDLYASKIVSSYDFANTVICDDEQTKLRKNPVENCVIFPSFNPNTTNNEQNKEQNKEDEENQNKDKSGDWVNQLYQCITLKFDYLLSSE